MASPMKGEMNGRAKLTQLQVNEIRQNYIDGATGKLIKGWSCRKLAAAYGVGKSQIHNILVGKRW